MRDFAKIPSLFLIGPEGHKVGQFNLETRHIALYLMIAPGSNMLGVYYKPLQVMAHETKIPLEEVEQAIKNLCDIDFCRYDSSLEYIWVVDMARDQHGGPLKPNDNRVKHINSVYKKLPPLDFSRDFFDRYVDFFHLESNPSEDVLKPLRSKEKEKKKENEKKKEKVTVVTQARRRTVLESTPGLEAMSLFSLKIRSSMR